MRVGTRNYISIEPMMIRGCRAKFCLASNYITLIYFINRFVPDKERARKAQELFKRLYVVNSTPFVDNQQEKAS